ncbi:hypothetical protein NMY22_g16061 [Coprinellus aureogranulatus]|nr:hypothetical protein NMY22_g16061 [Coprinellus aureogranulatus]
MPSTSTQNTHQRKGRHSRRSLVERAKAILAAKDEDWQRQLALCFVEDDNFEIVEHILGTFNVANIPSPPLDLRNVTVTNALSEASMAVADLLLICLVFSEEEFSHLLSSRVDRFYSILAEHWEGITRWLTLLVACRFLHSSPSVMIRRFSQLLCLLATGMESHRRLQDIIHRPCTIDLIYVLLSQVDPDTGLYYVLPPQATDKSLTCAVLHMLQLCLQEQDSARELSSRLVSYRKATRDAIFESLLLRAEQLVSTSYNLSGALANLVEITFIFCRLAGDVMILFYHENIAKTLCFAWPRRFLPDIEESSPRATRGPAYLDLGSRLHWCSSRLTVAGFVDRLLYLVPYLYHHEAVATISSLRGIEPWVEALGEDSPSSIYEKVYHAYRTTFRQVVTAERNSDNISICSNPKHSRVGGFPKSQRQEMKSCSRCRTVAYCSLACQKQDWVDFHSKECAHLSRKHQRNGLDSRSSLWRRRTSLSILEQLTNSACPSPSGLISSFWDADIVPDDIGFPLLRSKPRSTALLLDYHALGHEQTFRYERVQIYSFYNAETCDKEYMAPVLPRYQRFIDDTEANEDKAILVSGRFRIDSDSVLAALVLMRYDPDADEGKRYSVRYSTFFTVELEGWIE